jgi:cytochrome d ubiquinol oxidase subunit II
MDLEVVWFWLIAVLWGGYFVLEGFDFGVGILLPFLARDEDDRDEMFETIGPVWDGNEVWLVVAGGATFAAFPAWYATMFSGFYLALLLVLVCLIVRVVSFEWREKSESPRWRAGWRWANTVGSVGGPFIWGVALANLVHGVPLDSGNGFAGSFGDLFSGYTVLAGLATVLMFGFHGATFLTLRTSGELCKRAAAMARRLAVPVAAAGAGLLALTVAVAHDRNERGIVPVAIPAAIGIAVLALAVVLVIRRRSGWAFVMTALAVLSVIATIFTGLYPRVLVSHPNFSNSLTVSNAASSHYALVVITVVAAIFAPLVLIYQGWTYHVFRRRVGGEAAETPLDAVARRRATPGSPAG